MKKIESDDNFTCFVLNDNAALFSLTNEDGYIIKPDDWADNGFQMQFAPLRELIDNGHAMMRENGIEVPFENLYELNNIERSLLLLPEKYPFKIYVQADGLINSPDFRYRYAFCVQPRGDYFKVNDRKGPFVELDEGKFFLHQTQYKLLSLIDDFNRLPEKTYRENLIRFSEIKSLCKDCPSEMDLYLEDKEVVVPERIKVHLDSHDGNLEVIPSLDDENGEAFSRSFDKMRDVREICPAFGDKGKKIHVVMSDDQVVELKKIKSDLRHIDDPQKVRDIIDRPEAYLDTDCIDITDFYSDRVKEIGLAHPHVYGFLSPYKSQWIPGFTVEDKVNGSTNITFKDEQEVEELEKLIEEAETKDEGLVTFQGAELPVVDAKEMAAEARCQLAKMEPVTDDGEFSVEEVKRKHKVLLIEENTEELGFAPSMKKYSLPEKISLFEDEYLNKTISLKSHQAEGIAWLQDLYVNGYEGCLLADDMGLGKTLQVLYFIDWHFRHENKEGKPYLIVAPVSLLENWENEYHRFFENPRLPVFVIGSVPKGLDKSFVDKMTKPQIILVGYEAMRRGQLSFGAVDFAVIALDEAQKIKTPGTLVTNAAKALKADFRIAMTGTPVENTFMDFWCITDFVLPGLLGNAKEFASKYYYPLTKGYGNVEKMGESIRGEVGGFFMRRLKTDIADELPQKNTVYRKVVMPDVQRKRYLAVIDNENGPFAEENMLVRIQYLKAISDHPYLNDDFSKIDTDVLVTSSAKMMATFRILDEIKAKGEKAIIFSERREMQRILQLTIYSRYNLFVHIINGDTATHQGRRAGSSLTRQQTIDKFEAVQGFNIIIMSPLAAGMGLNVVGANHVIHYSRHWNPAKEMQATDRAYRIGQTKDVTVYYPMAVDNEFDTFDIVLDGLLNSKLQLASSTLYPSDMIEVSCATLYNKLFTDQQVNEQETLTEEEINILPEQQFKVLISKIFEMEGYEVIQIDQNEGLGLDFIAHKNKDFIAVRCNKDVSLKYEIFKQLEAAKKVLELRYQKEIHGVLTCFVTLTDEEKELGTNNGFNIVEKNEVINKCKKYQLNWAKTLNN